MFVFVLLSAAVLPNILAKISIALSVAPPNSKYGVLGFGCSFKADVRYLADWKLWSTEFVVVISILEGKHVLCTRFVCLLFL